MAQLPPHDMGPAASAFREKVRAWLVQHWTPERRAAHLRKPFKERGWDAEFSKLMGRDGWIGVGWPKTFGGQGRSPSEHIAFITEMANASAPLQAHSTGESIVAQALFLHGTKAQQDEWLPAIRRGERSFALGYSEPEAGSDLAALRTRAVRDGDDWVVNGQKLWSTGGDKADYIWLAVRTDPEAKKHAGISVLMVDLRSPGVTLRPSTALYGKTFSSQFYDNVRVPARNLLGEPGDQVWYVFEVVAPFFLMAMAGTYLGIAQAALDEASVHLRSRRYSHSGEALRDECCGHVPILAGRAGFTPPRFRPTAPRRQPRRAARRTRRRQGPSRGSSRRARPRRLAPATRHPSPSDSRALAGARGAVRKRGARDRRTRR